MNIFQKELLGLQHKQQLLAILIFSLVTVVIWVGLGLITSQSKTSISPVLLKLAKPLNPTLNLEVIESLEQKRDYPNNELVSFPIFRALTPTKNVSNPLPAPVNQLDLLNQLPSSSGSEVVFDSGNEAVSAPVPETTSETPAASQSGEPSPSDQTSQ